ncbi:MAG: HD domain-containing protein [Nitrospinae bacterium]|nr:HD domain-containing protein [Nitrospinota bacterium]
MLADTETVMHLLVISEALLAIALAGLAMFLFRLSREKDEEFMGMLISLSSLIELKDGYTEGHCARVRGASSQIGAWLELSRSGLNDLAAAGALHDIGKVGVPDSVLKKPGKLDENEFALIKAHPALGADALKSIRGLKKAATIIRHHHEAYGGGGYPDGLAGEAIPIGARIISVIDAYDAMTSDRAYRKALTPERARQILVENSGKQFDPSIVDLFLRYEAGMGSQMLDPVCGMPGVRKIYAITGKKTFHFCSEACKNAFLQDPEKYGRSIAWE